MEELSLGEEEKKKVEISSQIFIHAREFKAVVGWREEGGQGGATRSLGNKCVTNTGDVLTTAGTKGGRAWEKRAIHLSHIVSVNA